MSAANSPSPWDTEMKWDQMAFAQKMVFVGKLVIMMCTFGFVFPNLLE